MKKISLWVGICCVWLAAAGEVKEYSLLLLSYLPDAIQPFDRQSATLAEGIYVDRFHFAVAVPEVDCSYERKLFTPLDGVPDYFKFIDMQKVVAWGNYDGDFTLDTLHFISLENRLQVYRIDSENIRGFCRAGSNLALFMTSRNPPRLTAYDMDDGGLQTVRPEDYLNCAENVGVRINADGTVNFTGTGLQAYSPGFRIPESFLRDELKDYDGTWTLLLNRSHSVVLSSSPKEQKRVVVWDRESDRWRCFELDKAYVCNNSFGDYLVFQTDSGGEYGRIAYVYNLLTDELVEFKLMPFTKVIYYSKSYAVLAQPYRLLLATRSPDGLNILKVVDYPLAWYVQMAAKD